MTFALLFLNMAHLGIKFALLYYCGKTKIKNANLMPCGTISKVAKKLFIVLSWNSISNDSEDIIQELWRVNPKSVFSSSHLQFQTEALFGRALWSPSFPLDYWNPKVWLEDKLKCPYHGKAQITMSWKFYITSSLPGLKRENNNDLCSLPFVTLLTTYQHSLSTIPWHSCLLNSLQI